MTSDFTKMFLDKRNQDVGALSQIDEQERKRLEPYVPVFKEVLQSIETRINALASESEEVRVHFTQNRDLVMVSGNSHQLDFTAESPGDYISMGSWIYSSPDGKHITVQDKVFPAITTLNNIRTMPPGSSGVQVSGSLTN